MSCARLPVSLLVVLLAAVPQSVGAQTCQVAPFGGYQVGGRLYDVFAGTPVDVNGAPSFGLMLDVFLNRDTSVSFLYSRQQAPVEPAVPRGSSAPYTTVAIEHWHLGGTVELNTGRARPFFAASAGLTRIGGANDSETRFSMAGGGGIKLMPSPHLGVRLDGRLYAVFVDGHLVGGVCGTGVCLVHVDVSVAWQAEFTAGLVVSF